MSTPATPSPAGSGSPEDLELLEAAFAELDALFTRVAAAIGRLVGSGVCEAAEGLELEHWLRLAGRLPGGDARRLVATGEALADLPGLRRLLEAGLVSYSCVQAICGQLRGLSRAQRQLIDARLAATAAERGDLDALGADGLLEAVAIAVDQLRTSATLTGRDRRRERASRVIVQPRLDGSGGVAIHDLGPVSFAAYLSAVGQAAADALAAGDRPEQIPSGLLDSADDPTPIATHDHHPGNVGDTGTGDAPVDAHSAGAGSGEGAACRAAGEAGEPPRSGRRASRAQLLAMGARRMAACYLGQPVNPPTPDPDPAPGDGAGGGEGDGSEELDRGDFGQAVDVPASGNQDGGADAVDGRTPAHHASDADVRGVCAAGCGGARRRWRPARPLIEVLVDLRSISSTPTGGILLSPVAGDLPRLTARTIDAISHDSEVRAAIFEGQRPLAVSARRRAGSPTPPAKVRTAVRLRDRGDRFPGSRLPLEACDLDHLTPRAEGGSHHPSNLAPINTHTNRHRRRTGWQLRLFHDGELHATRGKRTWRSLPRGTPLANPPPIDPGPVDPEPKPANCADASREWTAPDPPGDTGTTDASAGDPTTSRRPPDDLPF